jgi:hypothetical protein
MQVIPLPNDQISFQREGLEITRYYYATNLNRPFLYPINGPSGRSLTRMGHPHDPITHSHHNSVWLTHADVNGVSFWEDRAKGRIVHQRVERLEDGEREAHIVAVNAWRTEEKVLMNERRQITVRALPNNEWMLFVDVSLEANGMEITLGETAFGLIGVRMAKTIGVADGGGTLRNSAGQVNEAEAFRKPAQWVDYSGPITSTAIEGITLMDHPLNFNHPSIFHVRNDGWMGSSLTFKEAKKLTPGQPVALRYGLYILSGLVETNVIKSQYDIFTKTSLPDLRKPVKP